MFQFYKARKLPASGGIDWFVVAADLNRRAVIKSWRVASPGRADTIAEFLNRLPRAIQKTIVAF